MEKEVGDPVWTPRIKILKMTFRDCVRRRTRPLGCCFSRGVNCINDIKGVRIKGTGVCSLIVKS